MKVIAPILICFVWLFFVMESVAKAEEGPKRKIPEIRELRKRRVETTYEKAIEKEEVTRDVVKSTKSKLEIESDEEVPKNSSLTRQQQALEHNELGNLYESKGRYEQAIAEYEKAIELDPKLAMAYSNLGSVYSNIGLLNKAIVKYKKAIRIDPKATFAHNNLGNAYYARGNYSRAIKEYKITLILDPSSAYAYNNLGDAYLRKGHPNLAIRYFNKAIELDPDSFIAYSNLGDAYQLREEWDKAIEYYEKALELKPDYIPAGKELSHLRLKVDKSYESTSKPKD